MEIRIDSGIISGKKTPRLLISAKSERFRLVLNFGGNVVNQGLARHAGLKFTGLSRQAKETSPSSPRNNTPK